MKLSMLPVSMFGSFASGETTIPQWARRAKEMGLDGFDISCLFLTNHTPNTLYALRDQLREVEGIEPTMVCAYPDFTHPDAMERNRQMDCLRRDMAVSSELGFRTIRVTAGQNHPGLELREAAKRCADCFAQLVPVAQRYGIRMLVENHSKPGAWPLIDFTFRPEAFLAVYEEIVPLPVGVNFDTANAVACGADLGQLLRQVISKVECIHLNETAQVGRWVPAPIGKGLVDFDLVFDILRQHGYDGDVSIEEAGGTGWQGAADAVAFARKYV